MKRMAVMSLLLMGIVCCLAMPVQAQSQWGINVNYPGLGIKYGLNKKVVVELKVQFGKDVFVIGPRFYYSLSPWGKTIVYGGVEGDYLTFESEISKGSGFVFLGFAGLEYFVSPNVGLSVDFGPAYVNLKDKETKEKESGVDLVVNIGLTYYFKGGEK